MKKLKALKSYEKSLQKPNAPEVWENVARIQFYQKNYKAACQNIQKASKFGSPSANS